MKIGFRTGGFGGAVPADTLQAIRRAGYDGVELCLEHPQLQPNLINERLALELQGQIVASGLQLASASYHADGEEIRRRLVQTVSAVKATNLLGSSVLILNTERSTTPDPFPQVVKRMTVLCELAQQYKVYIAVEPEPLLVIGDTRDMLRLLDAVGSDRLRVNLDIGHSYCSGEDVSQTIRTLGDRIVHYHIEDIKDRVHKHLLPGEGDMPLRQIIDTALETGFDGFFTIDLFSFPEDGESFARKALEAFRKIVGR